MKKICVLLINPWIYDFAAYDLWLRPIGLLTIAGYLADRGCSVRLVDCLDRFHPRLAEPKYLPRTGSSRARFDHYGCGKFIKTEIDKPTPINNIRRPFSRYGMPIDVFADEIKRERPDVIIVTSSMTYWYPGVVKAIEVVRDTWPTAPIILGGTYATIMPGHARRVSGADRVFTGSDLTSLGRIIEEETSMGLEPSDNGQQHFPDYSHSYAKESIAVKTSSGCPFRCTYCASAVLNPVYVRYDPSLVLEHLLDAKAKFGTIDIALYDDALLVNAEKHAIPLLKMLIEAGSPFRLHTPNSLHAQFIDDRIAVLLKEAGFVTIRLSLETTDPDIQQSTGNKVLCRDIERSLGALSRAGFDTEEIGVYVMLGLRGRSIDETHEDAEYISSLGARPIIASFSPIPGTAEWEQLLAEGTVSESIDPLWHNNTIFPLLLGHELEDISKLRKRIACLPRGRVGE